MHSNSAIANPSEARNLELTAVFYGTAAGRPFQGTVFDDDAPRTKVLDFWGKITSPKQTAANSAASS
jgi:hypothetical protein